MVRAGAVRRLVLLRRRRERRGQFPAPRRHACGRPIRTGLIMDLLAAEITALTGKDPGEHYQELTAEFGTPLLHADRRTGDSPSRKRSWKSCRPRDVKASTLAGEPITAKLTRAPGNNAPIGGLKVIAAQRLVCGAAVGHGEHLQDLCRELQGRCAPQCHRQRSSGNGERRARVRVRWPSSEEARRFSELDSAQTRGHWMRSSAVQFSSCFVGT